MTVSLDIPAIRQNTARLSVADFHRLGEGFRAELIDGIPLTKMPKSPLHRFIVDRLRRILANQIRPELIMMQEAPLTIADSEPEPDLVVVFGLESDYRFEHPTSAELVVEVAISSLEIDRVKAHIYAEAGVKEYWIVCPEDKRVEVYRQPTVDGYREVITVAAPAAIDCAALPGVTVDLGALFA